MVNVANFLTFYNTTSCCCSKMSKKWYNLTTPVNLLYLDSLKMKNKHPGYYLKIHRLNNNLTVKQLAKEIQTFQHTLEAIEMCKNYPSPEVSQKLAEYFNLSTKFFYDMYLEETDDISVKLNSYIKEKNTSTIKLSKLLEVDKRSIRSWINGKNRPSRESYKKLKKFNII